MRGARAVPRVCALCADPMHSPAVLRGAKRVGVSGNREIAEVY